MKTNMPPIGDNALLEAKASWLDKFTGAVAKKPQQIGSPLVQGLYKRTFYITARNFHFISVFGRVLLGEEAVKEPEDHLRKQMEKIKAELEARLAATGVEISDAGLDAPVWNAPSHVEFAITSPFSKRHMDLLMLADQYMSAVATLWLNDLMDDSERAKHEREVKQRMRAIATSGRNMFLGLRKRMNEKKAAEAAGAEKDAKAATADQPVAEPKVKKAAAAEAKVEPAAAEVAVA